MTLYCNLHAKGMSVCMFLESMSLCMSLGMSLEGMSVSMFLEGMSVYGSRGDASSSVLHDPNIVKINSFYTVQVQKFTCVLIISS